MKAGAVPYWPCGGEVLTRALDAAGRIVARPVAPDETRRLIGFYGAGAEGAALRAAQAAVERWRLAAVGA